MRKTISMEEIRGTCRAKESWLFDDEIFYILQARVKVGERIVQNLSIRPLNSNRQGRFIFASRTRYFSRGQSRRLRPSLLSLGEVEVTPRSSEPAEGTPTLEVEMQLWEKDLAWIRRLTRWHPPDILQNGPTPIRVLLTALFIVPFSGWIILATFWALFSVVTFIPRLILGIALSLDENDLLGEDAKVIPLTEDYLSSTPTPYAVDLSFDAQGHGADYRVEYTLQFRNP